MPIYEFECESCKQLFEEICKSTEDTIFICPDCGATCSRIISKNNFHLKGVGWSDDARKQRQRWYDAK